MNNSDVDELEQMQLYELFSLIEINNLYNTGDNEQEFLEYEDEIYQQINKFYAQQCGKSLDINVKNNKIKLYEWVREQSRYQLLNELIKVTIGRFIYKEEIDGEVFDNTDYFVMSNMNALIRIMIQQYGICINRIVSKKEEITKVSKNEIDEIIKKILVEIDPTLEWLEIYISAKRTRRIVYLDELNDEEKEFLVNKFGLDSLCKNATLLGEDGPYITIMSTNTIEDVLSIIHEFIHYTKRIKNLDGKHQQTLAEFYSIFYELYALEFLKRCGYSEQEIATINSNRLENTMKLVGSIINVFRYIEMYLENSQIEEEIDIESNKKSLEKINNNRFNNNSKKMLDPKINANKLCDRCIKQLILCPFDVYLLYPYIIGNYLAIEAMEKINVDENILSKIKSYMYNAIDIDPYDVFLGLGCDVDKLQLQRIDEELKHIDDKNYVLKLNV